MCILVFSTVILVVEAKKYGHRALRSGETLRNFVSTFIKISRQSVYSDIDQMSDRERMLRKPYTLFRRVYVHPYVSFLTILFV